jgi:EAL domain-containing protein (putative c-di-GMP-specific phosphodiesterase class I)/AmiR/NasT family two-component response regulator
MEVAVRALIVDDSLAICQLLEQQLLHYGIDAVEYCHDGEQALDRVKNDPTRYDALFIDLHMERMDGLELMHQLSELRYRGGVVVISALDNRIIEFALELISNYHLRVLGSIEKPFQNSLIAFMVRRIKNSRGQPTEVETLPKRREVMQALRGGQLQSYFQPQISSRNNKITGFECLTRLNIPGREQLKPCEFMPVIDRFNLYEPLLEALFENAAPEIPRIIDKLGYECHFGFNLSPQQLFNDALPDLLNDYCKHLQVDKRRIVIEITENQSMASGRQLKNLNRLRIHGFELSLDDYGAGFTNLRQIKNLPFAEIKLDSLLIDGLHKDKILKIIVDSVRQITNELGMRLVAEGISDSSDLLSLSNIGVDVYQGYLFCRPKQASEILRWIPHWHETISGREDKLS